MTTSELLNILLSSAVIVALIEWISKNKSNYLQHITNNRAEWRKSLKDISVKLYKSDKRTIGSVFTELKVNLNSYGLHPSGNYPSIICKRFFPSRIDSNSLIEKSIMQYLSSILSL